MNVTEAVRRAADGAGMSLRGLSGAAGRSPNYANSVLTQAERMGADLTCGTAALLGEAAGYSLALVPAGEVPAGALVIDAPGR